MSQLFKKTALLLAVVLTFAVAQESEEGNDACVNAYEACIEKCANSADDACYDKCEEQYPCDTKVDEEG